MSFLDKFKSINIGSNSQNSLAKFRKELKETPSGFMSGSKFIGQNMGYANGQYIGQTLGYADGVSGDPAVQALPQQNVMDSKFTIVIANSNAAPGSSLVTLFNPNRPVAAPAGVTITCPTIGTATSYDDLQRDILTAPKFIAGLRMSVVTSTAQYSNPIQYFQNSSQGATSGFTIQPLDSVNPMYNVPTILDLKDIAFLLSKDTGLSLQVNDGETLTLLFTVRSQFAPSNTLQGMPAINVSQATGPVRY